MRKLPLLILFLSLILLIVVSFFNSISSSRISNLKSKPGAVETTTAVQTVSALKDNNQNKVILDVPFVPEAPENIWTGPWKNACEEASIVMVQQYYYGNYSGDKKTSIAKAKSLMENLFNVEDRLFGSNVNSTANQTNYLLNNYADNVSGIVKQNPSVAEIKAQIKTSHPVITFHNGFDLHNPHIPFLATGSAYHSMVVIGFDDGHNQFIVNDPGDYSYGKEYRYDYATFMDSLHDFDTVTGKADGPARVIFTSSSKL